MLVSEFINSEAFKKADDDSTIWSWDRLNGYYQFNTYMAHVGRFLRLSRINGENMTKESFLKNAFKYSTTRVEMNIWKRLLITYASARCSVVLEDRGIVIRRDESYPLEKAEESFFRMNRITKDMVCIPKDFNNGEYA